MPDPTLIIKVIECLSYLQIASFIFQVPLQTLCIYVAFSHLAVLLTTLKSHEWVLNLQSIAQDPLFAVISSQYFWFQIGLDWSKSLFVE